MINEFSPEVLSELGYYVYRLIDPRNGQTFYVGKGKGNRIFQHVKCAIDFYDGADGTDEDDPNKLKTIKEIMDEGLEVIHVIQRWHLTEDEAFQVESALIDAYQGLSNIQGGHHSEFGVTNVEQLEKRFHLKVYEEPTDFKYVLIKVKYWRLDELLKQYPETNRYEATRWRWKIKPRSITEYPYAFSVTDGVVKEVYKINKWYKTENSNRYAFDGEVANDEIRNRFVNKRIPDIYSKKGMASPVLFSKN
jgi:uncharacterized protein